MTRRSTATGLCVRAGFLGITAASLALSMAGAAPPQVGAPVQLPVDPTVPCVFDRVGPSLSVSPFVQGQPARIIVAWSAFALGPPSTNVECAICLNDNLTFTTQSLAWQTPCLVRRTDPTTCDSPATGDLYVGGRAGNQAVFQRLRVNGTVLEPDASAANVIWAPGYCSQSVKGSLVMGPQPPGTWSVPETQYFAHTLVDGLSFLPPLLTIKSRDVSPPDYQGPPPSHPHNVTSEGGGDPTRYAFNARPTVILDGLRKGRLVVVSTHVDPSVPLGVTFSDNPGDASPVWAQNIALDAYGPNADPIFTPGDSFAPTPGGIPVTTAASIATDPVNPNRVYIVFTGRVSPTTSNLDLFIARSYNFGETFLPEDTVRITDDKVRICSTDCTGCVPLSGCPAETDEWLPAITVDKYGGINLMFFRAQTQDYPQTFPPAPVKVRYVRWSSDAALTAGAPQFRSDFASTEGDSSWEQDGFWIDVRYGYHTLAASGCYVYAAYSAKVPVSCGDYWRVFVRRIVVGPCIADFNQSGMVNEEDLALFYDSYTAADPKADMNADDFVDNLDEDEYLESYCDGCPTDF